MAPGAGEAAQQGRRNPPAATLHPVRCPQTRGSPPPAPAGALPALGRLPDLGFAPAHALKARLPPPQGHLPRPALATAPERRAAPIRLILSPKPGSSKARPLQSSAGHGLGPGFISEKLQLQWTPTRCFHGLDEVGRGGHRVEPGAEESQQEYFNSQATITFRQGEGVT